MLYQTFLNKLKEKYNYDEKTIKALSLILPSMISYYGEDYSDIILNAIFNCEIIPCTSHQTISKVLNEKKLTKTVGASLVSDIDIKRAESVYIPNIEIIYNDTTNSYEIKKIDRIIVTSHTYNYDSLKGIEILTHALCHLVKGFDNEFVIEENMLTIRNGLSYEKRKIVYDNGNITLYFIEDYGKSLEEGFTLYDTEKIASNVYNDTYKCYDYATVYTIAMIIKEKYKLKNLINSHELQGDVDTLKKVYNKDMLDKLNTLCDECLIMENEMLMSYTRDDKNRIAILINKKINEDIYDYLISLYQNKQSIRN